MYPAQLSLPLIALMFLASTGQSQDKRPAGKEQAYPKDLRCAYIGRWGSFHLIGTGGSAAYALGNDKFVADLRSVGQDADYWYYTPSKGDPSTSEWALARKPDGCGMYWVWRGDGGRWHPYEPTRAWGLGLGGEQGTATSVRGCQTTG